MVVAGKRLLCCAISDLSAGDDTRPDGDTQGLDPAQARRMRLCEQTRAWAVDGVDIVQLREKQLESGELFALAAAALAEIHAIAAMQGGPRRTRLVVNGRADVAAAAGADGVHLRGGEGELTPVQARQVFTAAGLRGCVVSVSCHAVEEVSAAREGGADLILFGPVFEKRVGGEVVVAGVGLERLRNACAAAGETPVLALGGVTEKMASTCVAAGAAGIAGIRLFSRKGRGQALGR